jgi:acrosin
MLGTSDLRKISWFLLGMLLAGQAVLPGRSVGAEIPLERATVQSLNNTVYLLLKNQASRPAKIRDAMSPGDALSTAKAARAELRFNDGSLARVGERTLFQFLPRTRNFRLNNGTVLLLIPPGRGRTQIQTPNAVTGVRGSALFVRYVPENDMTVVGALTTSGIEVTNRDRNQNLNLNGGQMAVLVRNQIVQVYNFDLREFYETSGMVSELSLAPGKGEPPSNPDLAAVRSETVAAVNAQPPISQPGTGQLTPDNATGRISPPLFNPALPLQEPVLPSVVFPPTFALPNQPGGIPTDLGQGNGNGNGGGVPVLPPPGGGDDDDDDDIGGGDD